MTTKEFKHFCLNFLKRWQHLIMIDEDVVEHQVIFREKDTKKEYRISVKIEVVQEDQKILMMPDNHDTRH